MSLWSALLKFVKQDFFAEPEKGPVDLSIDSLGVPVADLYDKMTAELVVQSRLLGAKSLDEEVAEQEREDAARKGGGTQRTAGGKRAPALLQLRARLRRDGARNAHRWPREQRRFYGMILLQKMLEKERRKTDRGLVDAVVDGAQKAAENVVELVDDLAKNGDAEQGWSGTLSCFWLSVLPTIWPKVIRGFQA